MEWVDCFASANPVTNGVLIDDPSVIELSQELCNAGSTLRDHNSYWANRDQFVSFVVGSLAQPALRKTIGRPPVPELQMRVEQLNFIGRRRYVRVGIRRAIDWIAMASIVVAASQEPQAWANFTDYLLHYLTAWWAELHGETPEPHYFTISWAALGYLALVLIPYGVTRSFWRVWNEAEMRAIVEGRAPRADVSVPISMFLQVVIGLVLLFEQFPPFWIFLPIVIGVVAAHFIALSFADPYQMDDVAQSVPSNEPRSNVDHVWSLVKFFVTLHFVNFSLGLGGWEAFVWLVDTLFGGSILDSGPMRCQACL